MKKIFTFIFVVMLGVIGCCVGCDFNSPHKIPQKVYKIGQQYTTDSCDYIIIHDANEERFIFIFMDKDPSADNSFSFTFTYDNINSLRNSIEFTYINSFGEEIVFDENGYYSFDGDITVYISYKNARQEIKTEIEKRSCSISLPFGTFIF